MEVFYEYIVNTFTRWLDREGIKRPVIVYTDYHETRTNYYLSVHMQRVGIILIGNSGVCCVANLGLVKFSYRFLETIFFYLFNILTSQKKRFPFFGDPVPPLEPPKMVKISFLQISQFPDVL